MLVNSVDDHYQRASAAMQHGDLASALVLLKQGLAEQPNDSELWHGAGRAHAAQGDFLAAAEHYERAAEIEPKQIDHRIEQARSLVQAGRYLAAIRALSRIEKRGRKSADYCTLRGNAERGAGNSGAAIKWIDRALRIEPRRTEALFVRADTAIERDEPDAVRWYDRALEIDPGNPAIWLGKAQALDCAGDQVGALTIMQQVAKQTPSFTPGLRFLAQLRHTAGEPDFASHFAEAASAAPTDPSIPDGWAHALAGFGFNAEAADIAAAARRDWPDHPQLALLEAAYAGAAGESDRAEAIYSVLDLDTAERWSDEARHRIRRGDYEAAKQSLAKALDRAPGDIGAWALRDIVWRLTGDKRSAWLHGREGLVQTRTLSRRRGLVGDLVEALRHQHEDAPVPIGQSVRGGSQTLGRLLSAGAKPFAELARALRQELEEYRNALPPIDLDHPLLRHREDAWRFEASWSVRFTGGGGHHAAHIHPNAIISSALYLAVPDVSSDREAGQGWLELGAAPADLGVELEPLARIAPEPSMLVLFPSTLYHGTTAFAGEGERITAVFDVVLG